MFSSLSSRLLFVILLASSIIGCSGATSEDLKNGDIISGIINTSISDSPAHGNEVVSVPDEVVSVPDEVVSSSKTGVATILWLPPTENTDGTVLNDLAGYVIYYGTADDSLTESVTINSPGVSSYTIENLDNNTVYYYAITSVNSSNIQSGYSRIASKRTSS